MTTKRILIADDDHEVLQLLSIMAIKEGYVVSGVKDGIDLLSTFEKEKFDLIITDLLMVNLNGASAIEILKMQGSTVPVVALTGRTHQETQYVEDKFVKVFRKPCNFKELFKYVNSVIGSEPAASE
jgi:DNA-binding response OmpR family regulator